MAPFIKAVGEDMTSAGESRSVLPTSTSARVQPAKPLAPFGGCEAPFSSTIGPNANRQGHIKVRSWRSGSQDHGRYCPILNPPLRTRQNIVADTRRLFRGLSSLIADLPLAGLVLLR